MVGLMILSDLAITPGTSWPLGTFLVRAHVDTMVYAVGWVGFAGYKKHVCPNANLFAFLTKSFFSF